MTALTLLLLPNDGFEERRLRPIGGHAVIQQERRCVPLVQAVEILGRREAHMVVQQEMRRMADAIAEAKHRGSPQLIGEPEPGIDRFVVSLLKRAGTVAAGSFAEKHECAGPVAGGGIRRVEIERRCPIVLLVRRKVEVVPQPEVQSQLRMSA